MLKRTSLSLLFVLVSAVSGWAIEFSMPLICDYGEDCYIQNYVDTDPSPKSSDYDCGSLTYDGHKGTDFRISWTDYQKGVDVVAAAPGVVLRVRDGMEDKDARSRASMKGREIGNGVIVRHSDGYETVYAHMKRGSVRVKPGDQVSRGQVLGQVGLSGMTVFPHLHFGIRLEGKTVCPFTGSAGKSGEECGLGDAPLWDDQLQSKLLYLPTGLVAAGFFTQKKSLPGAVRDKPVTAITSHTPILLYAVTVFGVQQGDVARMRIIDPSGRVFSKSEAKVTRNQAQRLMFVGRKLGKIKQWSFGEYRGEYELIRDGKTVVSTKRILLVR